MQFLCLVSWSTGHAITFYTKWVQLIIWRKASFPPYSPRVHSLEALYDEGVCGAFMSDDRGWTMSRIDCHGIGQCHENMLD